MDTAMRLGIGSISKSITATLLVRLAERGRLTLDDPVGRWLPPIAHVDPAISVRQLLNHSSGVFDITDAPGYRDSILANTSARWTPQRTLALLRPPLFPRGMGWSYSNSNYQLAGLVAEAAGGRPYHQQVRDELLVPLGLTAPFLDQYEAPTGPLPGGWVGGAMNVMETRASTYSAAWAAGAYFSTLVAGAHDGPAREYRLAWADDGHRGERELRAGDRAAAARGAPGVVAHRRDPRVCVGGGT
jgi:D-alanyl-D-alanine carboxypeptidase